jgi:hypothetical protein
MRCHLEPCNSRDRDRGSDAQCLFGCRSWLEQEYEMARWLGAGAVGEANMPAGSELGRLDAYPGTDGRRISPGTSRTDVRSSNAVRPTAIFVIRNVIAENTVGAARAARRLDYEVMRRPGSRTATWRAYG